VAIDQKEI